MKNYILTIFYLLGSHLIFSQSNCLTYDGVCKEACELSDKASIRRQGSRASQELFDKSIAMCPTIAYSYFEKSVPYLKQGLLHEWKVLMDKAVKYDPSYLLNRGCNQIQFIRNYEEGVKDLDSLVSLRKNINIGFNPSGEYHAQLLRAIAYQKMGKHEKAIELCNELVEDKNYYQGPYDYFHIGIIHLKFGNLAIAKDALLKQNQYDAKAETHYYLSKVYKKEKNIPKQKEHLLLAKELYQSSRRMMNNYYHYIDKVFLSDIERGLQDINP